jgi:hypothetical protein
LDGKPLAGATVTLQRDDGPIGERVYSAETDAEGRYRIGPASGKSYGAPPGMYHVFITSVKLPPDANELTKMPHDPVPARWRSGAEIFEVPVQGIREADFAIKSR